VHEAIWTSGLDFRAESGDLSPADAERLVIAALDNRVDSAMLRSAWSAAFVADAAVCDFVTGLALPAFAFTNNGPIFSACVADGSIAVGRLFERVICSWQIGARKPDPIAFERLCAEIEYPPEQLLFVDDDADNVAAARSVGLTAITFATVERLGGDVAVLLDGFADFAEA
jgi:putative hydrolase of the HAD superfamily